MANWSLSPTPLPGPNRGGHPVVHVRAHPRLVFFPTHRQRAPTAQGTIFVVQHGQVVASYPACGGPEDGYDDDGHYAGKTPAGLYTLGPRHHHVTINWPPSCIPWGALIRRAANGEVEFDDGSGWKPATGDGAPMNKALIRSFAIAKKPVPPSTRIREAARRAFLVNSRDRASPLVTVWERNDFGKWAFNLRRDGKGTDYYVHTTPDDEYATAHNIAFSLVQSHGCVHIRPEDRDTMMTAGYLAAGIPFDVRSYEQKGPP
jgi:hypothetical protein